VDGRFRIEHLLPGTYGIYFSRKKERLHAWTEVTVGRGETVEAVVVDRSGFVIIPLGGAGDPAGLQAKAKWGESPSELRENFEYAWNSWPPTVLEASSSSLRVLVPEGYVRIGLKTEGAPEVWTEELAVTRGSVTEAPRIELRAAPPRTPGTPGIETPSR